MLNVVIYLILPSQAPVDVGLVFGTQWGRISQARFGLDTVVNIFEIVCTHMVLFERPGKVYKHVFVCQVGSIQVTVFKLLRFSL